MSITQPLDHYFTKGPDMHRFIPVALTSTLLAASIGMAHADDNWSLGAQAGTTGFGGNVSWRFDDHFAVTAGYSGYTYDDLDHTNDDVKYTGKIESDIYSLKLDIYPWATSGFFISAGAVRPDVQLKAVGRYVGDGTYDDLGISIEPEDAHLDGRAELSDSVEPYLGIGWRNSAKQGLGFYAEAGAFWIDPEVSLTPRGEAMSNPLVRQVAEQEARNQEDDLKDDLSKYNIYPVAVIGVEYTF
ncbi:hypothetical protein [Phytohalomonas tamaricis]|uniref:hypothetical protein n=1 Tax=Phytohalomonas tamaricis TaxID=2081032 RepID=UPI000D0ACAD1|nr:hypothetical protein [Phytohalomonas tamaricis]